MNAISKLEVLRRRLFGYSAPVATAAATVTILGWAVPAATQYFRGAPVVLSMKVIIGATVAVVVVTEAGFWFLGRDVEVHAAENARQLGKLGKSMVEDENVRKAYMAMSGKTDEEQKAFGQSLVDAAAKPVKTADSEEEEPAAEKKPAGKKAAAS
jgi:hypothetical protein